MCWPSDAVSLLGRACDLGTGKAYELTRQLSDHSVTYLRQLWQLSLDRRRARAGLAARQAVRVDWGETKRRLGTTGRNAKQELMPKADAGMGGCGAAASVQVKAPAGGMEACSDNDNTSRRIAQDHNVHGPAGTHG